jgi:hypothetical protein
MSPKKKECGWALFLIRFCAFPNERKKNGANKAKLKTLKQPFKTGVNLELSTPMEPLGWVCARGRRTSARANLRAQEGGAPPGPYNIPEILGCFRGGPGAHLPSACPASLVHACASLVHRSSTTVP